ncbi:MAG TPA: heme ABC exporter ATP-binding protein CcmA [Vicinamibacterales bacterium]|nr:heme ABC exporter ATP-binding protein CcmA [Vicinamibacterales bacterium]
MVDFARLSVADVARHYGRRKALSQISFNCDAGEIVGLLGPNGAGKSTLLNILATLVRPSKGTVTYGDHSAEHGPEVRAMIGMLGHDLFLYPELTARENLEFFAHLYGVADARAVASRALDRAGLAERADDFVAGFSRGMRQRVALERALLHDPKLILLDEPFTGLDQASTAALVSRLQERQRAGCLIVLATHDLEVADGLLNRAIFLKDGRIVGTDTDSRGLANRYRRAMHGGAA